MSRSAQIQIRRCSITASQLGSHEWLMNRESLPSMKPSTTVRESSVNRKVWWRAMAASS